MSIYSIAEDYRQSLLSYEEKAQYRLVESYATAEKDIQSRATDLLRALKDGQITTRAAMTRLKQYDRLLEMLDHSISGVSREVTANIVAEQLQALHMATESVRLSLKAVLPGNYTGMIQPVPKSTIDAVVGLAGDGSPLSDLLLTYGDEASRNIKDALIKGVAAGLDQKTISEMISKFWGQSQNRAAALARTETLRAYRTGTLADYKSNSDVVRGYRWLCAKSSKTCAACLASDGELFPLDVDPQNHVNCRCTVTPVLMDDPDTATRQTGTGWFEDQSDSTKEKILGASGYKAYKGGATLDDFIHIIDDPDWGKQRTARTP